MHSQPPESVVTYRCHDNDTLT